MGNCGARKESPTTTSPRTAKDGQTWRTRGMIGQMSDPVMGISEGIDLLLLLLDEVSSFQRTARSDCGVGRRCGHESVLRAGARDG